MTQPTKSKRSRGGKDINDLVAPPKKKSKTKKNKRKNAEGNTAATTDYSTKKSSSTSASHAATSSNSLETTATKDGQMMAQMLSTFSQAEQSQFRAYRRSMLSSNAVSEWLAACLQHQCPLPIKKDDYKLEDWTVPGQAEPITTTAAILAKVYAQRLVRTAIGLRQQAANQENNNSSNDDENGKNGNNKETIDTTAPISTEWILKAHEERTRQGLDPGFFLQAPSTTGTEILRRQPASSSSAFETRQLAALAAREAYEKAQKDKENNMDTE